uniref:Nucleocapsid protein n=1 Tax=Lepidopteran orthomyxo-related virus OKIAV1731 TaxID=2746277 RepID=A0A7D7JJ06_9ORTO|nr:nucleocapsid protein [Lepidopteran orthomyxo-related virus OKIAV1731]
MSTGGPSKQRKRKIEDDIVDPDTKKPIEDAKRPKIELDHDKKYRCIKSIVEAYGALINTILSTRSETEEDAAMRTPEDIAKERAQQAELKRNFLRNLNVSNHVTSIIFTLHNICRQEQKGSDTNMIRKARSTSFKVVYRGGEYLIPNESAKKVWLNVTKNNALIYKNFDAEDKENWYGTMGPYLDMFSAYSLRANELRLGHNNMPITKSEGKHTSFPVSKYGLSGAHHILLEGTSFPPERRSSIVQSLGPMTAWLGMIRSEGIYRRKYAAAVKRSMSHVPCIDEMIEITKTTKQASEISTLTTLVAEILLVTTARQATRMFFPLAIFAAIWKTEPDANKFCNFFSTTGAGGWYLYKKAMEGNIKFTMCSEMDKDKAAQIVFHSIFGTYKEDLSILSQITNIKTWFTREQLGDCFRCQGTSSTVVNIDLPKVIYYAKMSCANQTGLLSGVYNQVAISPCFSGARITTFDESFFEHIEKRRVVSSTGKTISQIINVLTSTLEELHTLARSDSKSIKMGTTTWKDMGTLDLERPGDDVVIVLRGTSKMFLGRNK